jgi:hypothetical protein
VGTTLEYYETVNVKRVVELDFEAFEFDPTRERLRTTLLESLGYNEKKLIFKLFGNDAGARSDAIQTLSMVNRVMNRILSDFELSARTER